MTDYIKSYLRDFSQELNMINKRLRQIKSMLDFESRMKILDDTKASVKSIETKMNLIEKGFQDLNPKNRQEVRPAIDSNKFEMGKLKRDIENMEAHIKKENMLIAKKDGVKDKFDTLVSVDKQQQDMRINNRMADEIADRQNNAIKVLKEDNDLMIKINEKTDNVEHTLSLHQQVMAVMENRELFNKLKMVIIIILLVIGDLLILYIKFLR